MFCKKTDGSNPRLVLSPFLLLTDNIRERHLVLGNVSDEVQVEGSGGFTVKPLLDYCRTEEGVAFWGCLVGNFDGRCVTAASVF
jgi:hypothetical protein